MASPTLQFKRGLFVNLPSLLVGEPGFTTDRSDLYIGNSNGNKFFGSHRYWTREDGTNALEFKFVDKDGDSGVSLRAPASVSTPVTYTLPEGGGTQGHFLKLGNSGVLEWASATSGVSYEDAQFIGISTFSGLIDSNGGADISGGLNVSGGSDFDSFDVSGIGTIATADINGGNIDGTVIGGSSTAAGTFTHLAYDSSSTSGISTVGSLYAGADKVLSVEGSDLTLSNIDAIDAVTKATLEATLALDPNDFDTLNVSGISTIGGLLDANGGLDVAGHSELDTVNVSGVSTFAVIIATSVKAPTLKTATITHSDGASALTIDATGNVGVATNLTVTGDLSVLGTTITVNTETLLVKDSLIEVGLVDDNGDLVAPSSDADIDVGMVFHYYSGSAKKAAVYWDDSTSRIAFASDASESSSVITATTYATILAGGLEINNACTGGTDEVISCVGDKLALSNIVIDGGSF